MLNICDWKLTKITDWIQELIRMSNHPHSKIFVRFWRWIEKKSARWTDIWLDGWKEGLKAVLRIAYSNLHQSKIYYTTPLVWIVLLDIVWLLAVLFCTVPNYKIFVKFLALLSQQSLPHPPQISQKLIVYLLSFFMKSF